MTSRTAVSRVRRVTSAKWFRITSRLAVGGGVLVAVFVHVGAGPFIHGLLSLDPGTVVAALFLAAVATAAAAWRWRLIARRLGASLPWSTAVGMYYQSQFLNTVLPGGVLGDVHRAVAHGRSSARRGAASRAVVLERLAGQVVQVLIALIVLACFGAEFEGYLLTALIVGAGALCSAGFAAVAVSVRVRGAVRREVRKLREAFGSAALSAQVVLASVVVVGCHVATFAIATAAVGVGVAPLRMLTLALVVLLAASVPLNVGGWGPREGVSGWAFALAGFGASAGVAASTLFGVLTIIAVAPGAIVTVVVAIRGRRAAETATRPPSSAVLPVAPPAHVLTIDHPEASL
jgi:uncharacterized membrane protein YbhN (UPF0104 family)